MCGIAGIFGNGLGQADVDALDRMTDDISHRGPDAEGVYHDSAKVCFLGHRRLSIIDLSDTANQPMADSEGEVIIVFNGEIYNHLDLRKELEQEFVFQTHHSDTETIIYAYKKWGMNFLDRVNGMFAIAIYDRRLRKLYLIRDRFGKKPLYYMLWKGRIFFASEARSFFGLSDFLRQPNPQAIYDYLTLLTTRPSETFFKNVFKVKASHYVEITSFREKPKTQTVKYWDISESLNVIEHVEYNEAILLTEKLLKSSVYLRNISDVPVAISLSGGIDSSLNLLLSRQVNHNLHAINISYTDTTSDLDESRPAQELATNNEVHFTGITINQNEYIDNSEEFSNQLLVMAKTAAIHLVNIDLPIHHAIHTESIC